MTRTGVGAALFLICVTALAHAQVPRRVTGNPMPPITTKIIPIPPQRTLRPNYVPIPGAYTAALPVTDQAVCLRSGPPAPRQDACRRAIAAEAPLSINTPRFRYNLALALIAANDPAPALKEAETAKAELTKIIDAKGCCVAEALVQRARLAMFATEYPAAITDLNASLAIDPNRIDAYRERAIALENTGDNPAALSDYTRLIAADKKDANLYLHRGRILGLLNRCRDSLSDFEQSYRLNPKSADILHFRGIAYMCVGQVDAAVQDLSKAATQYPNAPDIHVNYAVALRLANRDAEAIEQLNAALKLRPKHVIALQECAATYEVMGQPKLAMDDLDTAIKLAPDYAPALLQRARLSLKQGDTAGAQRDSMAAMAAASAPLTAAKRDALRGDDFLEVINEKSKAHRAAMPPPLPAPSMAQFSAARTVTTKDKDGVAFKGDLVWESLPTGEDFDAVYPESAMKREISGRVELGCIVQEGGALACLILKEEPAGEGFGEAARLIAGRMKMKANLPDGRGTAGGALTLPISFKIS